MAEREDLGAALTGLLAELASSRGAAAGFAAPQPQGTSLPLSPQMGVESRGRGNPAFEGQLSVPVGNDAEVSARGSYQKRDSYSPAEIMTMLGYNRRF